MGVTIRSKNYNIDMGGGEFLNLRTKVAELTTQDIFEHYKALTNYFSCTLEEKNDFFEDYNKKIEILDEKYDGKYSDILDKQNLDMKKANIVVENSGTQENLKEKCLSIIEKL